MVLNEACTSSATHGAPKPTTIPDLISIKDRKYIDHTATHLHRGPGDLMRYAALVTSSDSSDFGPHRMLSDAQRSVPMRACGACHAPPLYTSNTLTLAEGFTPPAGQPLAADILRVSVGTDPGLALKTRKGAGFYKVASLKGVWYRGRYLHDGAVTSLEEMFDAARLADDFVPTGFIPPGQKIRAVKGTNSD